MARRVKDARLDTRAARAKLPQQQEPHWRLITEGRHLGYYKGARGGTWVARFRPPSGGAYRKTTLAKADDTEDADGVTVLDYAHAQEKAREWFAAQLAPVIAAASKPFSLDEAVATYIEFLEAKNPRTADDTERRLQYHLAEEDRARQVGELDQEWIERWHRNMVRKSDDPDAVRRSKDSANRVLTMLKAALNYVYADPKKRKERGLTSADAWREVRPFKAVWRAREVHLDPAECKRLINATSGDLRNLVIATLLTGSRPAPGEIAQARVRDFRPDLHVLSIRHSKTGPRDVVLTSEGVQFFETLAAGRRPDDLLLPKDDGTAWKSGHHSPPMREAVEKAKLPADTCMYSLRHTYASQSILAGMNLKLLAENMGTSIKMLEDHYGKFIAASRRQLVEDTAFKLGLPKSNVRQMQPRA